MSRQIFLPKGKGKRKNLLISSNTFRINRFTEILKDKSVYLEVLWNIVDNVYSLLRFRSLNIY